MSKLEEILAKMQMGRAITANDISLLKSEAGYLEIQARHLQSTE